MRGHVVTAPLPLSSTNDSSSSSSSSSSGSSGVGGEFINTPDAEDICTYTYLILIARPT
jgi:hypothetical protein